MRVTRATEAVKLVDANVYRGREFLRVGVGPGRGFRVIVQLERRLPVLKTSEVKAKGATTMAQRPTS